MGIENKINNLLKIYDNSINSNELIDIRNQLRSLQHFIRTTVGITPLANVEQLTIRLAKITTLIQQLRTSSIITINEYRKIIKKINNYKKKLIRYKTFLQLHNDEAIAIAEDLEQKHIDSILVWKNYLYSLLDYNDYKLLFTPSNNIFQNSLICYIKTWSQLNPILQEYGDYFAAYKDNSLAQLLFSNREFIKALKNSQFFSGGEIGHCIIQRLFFMYSNVSTSSLATIILRSLIPGGHSHGLLEKDFFKCNSEAFKAEVIKLVLYKRLSLQNGVQPIAWIGSAKTLTTMLEDPNPSLPERRGIYLNCGEYLTPEFNRAWLLSLMEMGYEIKLVERQFPSIEKAILSNKPIDFLLLLAEEIRKMNDQNDPGACHSQYNGGDSPTATSLEILLLMNMGCTATKDIKEGTISLFKPKITAIDTSEYSSPKPEMLSQYRLSKRRSHSCFMPTASMKYRTKNQLIL